MIFFVRCVQEIFLVDIFQQSNILMYSMIVKIKYVGAYIELTIPIDMCRVFYFQQNQSLTSSLAIFWRLLQMNRSEWVTISIGCLACFITGLMQLIVALLLTKIIDVNEISNMKCGRLF